MILLNFKESLLKFDSFLNPYIAKDKEAIASLLIRLILLEPGTIFSEPKCGVGLIRNWRYCREDELPDLQLAIKEQVKLYLPELLFVDVVVRYNIEKEMMINIVIDKDMYSLRVDNEFKQLKLRDIIKIK